MLSGKTVFSLATLLAVVNAHGFISFAKSDLQDMQKAQKTDLSSSAWRAVPDNTGWIGAKFLTNEAIACGSSTTPFGTVASPGGRQFAESNQSAGKHMAVKAGGKVTLVVSGNPGEGWPHPKGHVQTYMADCGDSCVGKDATTLNFFKIQSEKNGIQNTLRAGGVNSQFDGNLYSVAIPAGLKNGKYLMRYELIAFGQSSGAEGGQDQYYPFCAQLDVQDGTGAINLNNIETVKFPGAYQNGNIDQNTVPGPAVINAASSGSSSGSSSNNGDNSNGGDSSVSTGSDNNGGSQTSTDSGDNSTGNDSSDDEGDCTDVEGPITLSGVSDCANMCLSIKFSEAGSLAPSCSLDGDANCFCSTSSFTGAFAQCLSDNCSASEASKAVDAMSSTCGNAARKAVKARMMIKKRHARSVASHSKRAHPTSHRVKRSTIQADRGLFEDVVVRRLARSVVREQS